MEKLKFYIFFITAMISVLNVESDEQKEQTENEKSHNKDGFFLNHVQDVASYDGPKCPSSEVISSKYRCQVKNKWVDCYRKHCCQGYNFVGGSCVPESVDPCEHQFCEQKCSVYFGRVICTCFTGYYFSPENHKNNIQPVCIDVDECNENNGGCDHNCTNNQGSFNCSCLPGYQLLDDGRSCQLQEEKEQAVFDIEEASKINEMNEVIFADFHNNKLRCYSSCNHVAELEMKIKELEERVVALSTAVRLYSFAAGPPGPKGEQGPKGPPGLPGKSRFPGKGNYWNSNNYSPSEDHPFDSWTVIKKDNKKEFCKCRRGPIGPPGAQGNDGLQGPVGQMGMKGEKGESGSFDFLMLMMADLRHDIQKLQEKVFPQGMIPKAFDLSSNLSDISIDAQRYVSRRKENFPEDNNLVGDPVHSLLNGAKENNLPENKLNEIKPESRTLSTELAAYDIVEDYEDYGNFIEFRLEKNENEITNNKSASVKQSYSDLNNASSSPQTQRKNKKFGLKSQSTKNNSSKKKLNTIIDNLLRDIETNVKNSREPKPLNTT